MVLRFKKVGESEVVFGTLANLNELKNINTDLPQYVNHSKVYVKEVGEYILRKSSSLIESSPNVIKPTTGSGRWIKTAEANENNILATLDAKGTVKAINGTAPDSNGHVSLEVGGPYNPSEIYNKKNVRMMASNTPVINLGSVLVTGGWSSYANTSFLFYRRIGAATISSVVKTTNQTLPNRATAGVSNVTLTIDWDKGFYYEGSGGVIITQPQSDNVSLILGVHENSSTISPNSISVFYNYKSGHFVGLFRYNNATLVSVPLVDKNGNTSGILQNDMFYNASVRFDVTKNKYFFTLSTINLLNDATNLYTGEFARPVIANPTSSLMNLLPVVGLYNHSLTDTNEIIFTHLYTERKFK